MKTELAGSCRTTALSVTPLQRLFPNCFRFRFLTILGNNGMGTSMSQKKLIYVVRTRGPFWYSRIVLLKGPFLQLSLTEFPFPKIDNGFFIPVPVPKNWECVFLLLSPKAGNAFFKLFRNYQKEFFDTLLFHEADWHLTKKK